MTARLNFVNIVMNQPATLRKCPWIVLQKNLLSEPSRIKQSLELTLKAKKKKDWEQIFLKKMQQLNNMAEISSDESDSSSSGGMDNVTSNLPATASTLPPDMVFGEAQVRRRDWINLDGRV